jgi:hypothetical protein
MTAASHPASGLLHPASCIRFVIATFVQQASGFWVQESCKPYNFRAPKAHWFWCTTFGTLHRGGVACRQSLSTMLAVVVLVRLLGL